MNLRGFRMRHKFHSLFQAPDSLLRTALTALLFYGVIVVVFGCYYEVYEAFLEAFYSGKLSPGYPFRSWYFIHDIGISHIYALLYSITAEIEWRTWLLSFYLLLSAVIILKLAAAILKDKLSGLMIFFIQAGIFFLLISEHITRFSYTRPAAMLAAAGLCAIIYYFPHSASISKNKGKFIALNLLFLIAALTRIEHVMAVTIFCFCFAACFQSGLVQAVRLFLFPFMVMLSLVAGVYIDIARSSEFYKQIEPDLEYRMSARGIALPPGSHTPCDTVKFRAASERLWSDPGVMTVNYLRSLPVKSSSPLLLDPQQWRDAALRVFSVAKNSYYLVLFSLCILVLMLISGSGKKKITGLAAFQLCFWVIIFMQSYSVRINDRFFSTVNCAYILLNIFAFFAIACERSVRHLVYFFVLMILTGAFHWSTLRQNAQMLEEDWVNNVSNLKEISKIASGEILVISASSFRALLSVNKPLAPIDVSGFRKVYMNENQAVALIHPYREYLESECRCDIYDFANFYRYLKSQPSEVYFLSSEPRLLLTKDYLKCFHNFDLEVDELENIPLRDVMDHEVGSRISLKLYRMGKG